MITTVIQNLGPQRRLSYIPPNGRVLDTNEAVRIAGIFDTEAYLSYGGETYQQLLDDLVTGQVRVVTDLTSAELAGVRSKLTKELKELTVVPVVHGAVVDTGITMTETPVFDGWVGVFMNGILYALGDGVTTSDFYFSTDPLGLTARPIIDIQVGDQLWANPAALGFALAGTDVISLVFCVP